ncbi:MAG: hypothetical protein QM811_05225 [Pirellulales bacterium]
MFSVFPTTRPTVAAQRELYAWAVATARRQIAERCRRETPAYRAYLWN